MALALRRLLRPRPVHLFCARGFGRRGNAGVITVNGKALDITDPGESVLDLCLRNNVRIPWDCNKGTCGTCRLSATMDGVSASVLTCQEKPADGMHLFLPEQVCAGLENPRLVADNVVRYLEYRMRAPKMADEEAELDEHLRTHGLELDKKLGDKKLKQLLRGEHIHLDKANVNDFEALVIARVVKNRNPELRMLDLNGNPGIGDVGAAHIAEFVVGTDHELRTLFLSSCSITDVGASSLAKALNKNDDLMILELRKNGLTDVAATELATSLVAHPELAHLYLSGNQIGEEGAMALAYAVAELAGKGRKVKVWLTDNPVPDGIKAAILDVVPKHTLRF